MKILVCITNYGLKNMEFLHVLIKEYRAMSWDVDMVVLSDIPKALGPDIEVRVGLPNRDPWSLPFAHKKVFGERRDAYDLFIYTEDDMLITERNIKAFLEAMEILGDDEIPGFLQYEVDRSGARFYPEMHGSAHWEPASVKVVDGCTFARFTNEHSACYVLTRDQLAGAIDSGGYLVAPYSRAPGKTAIGRYDIACSASTDPYTKCGLRKFIPISRMEDFLVRHLPNVYVDRFGLDSASFDRMIDAMCAPGSGQAGREELFETEKKGLSTSIWDKNYWEPVDNDILARVPVNAGKVLSVGCGWGVLEAELVKEGKEVVAVPLDRVISTLAESKGVRVVPPDFDEAFRALEGEIFDCIIFDNILHHLDDPVDIIRRSSRLLTDGGLVIAAVPNFHHLKVYKVLFDLKLPFARLKDFSVSHLRLTTEGAVRDWFKKCGLKCREASSFAEGRYVRLAKLLPGSMMRFLGYRILFVGQKP